MLPIQMAQATNALGVNTILRQERESWADLLPVLMRVSNQLGRFQSLDAKAMRDSLAEKLIAYLQGLRDFFNQVTRTIDPHFFKDEIALLKDELQRAVQATVQTERPDRRPLRWLLDVNECLVTAELLQRCGELVAGLHPDEYNGDYFL
jgi:hypothetical protein